MVPIEQFHHALVMLDIMVVMEVEIVQYAQLRALHVLQQLIAQLAKMQQ